MGLKVAPAEAARLVGRTERTIRHWISTGRLRAEPVGGRQRRPGVGPYRWLIDADELAKVPGVTVNAALLAEMQTRAAFTDSGLNVLERVSRLEGEVADLRRALDELRGESRQT